ncbi:1139_t:CDS:10 [Ambispora gerdemannii]|uniref:1139_t:CDS:1 n=1 Tax=Ambispora gerdemannii TaxID=144530 RepID=A0A9N8ZXY5_9GLOM|nr:1139_t:CDS:10 [Ambispora gerdemannii]
MPSTAHQAALDLYKSTVELEVDLRQLLKDKQPFDKEVATVRSKLRDSYEKIIFLDFDFAQVKDIEQSLWKYVFYRVIEEYRKRIRLAPTGGGSSKGPTARKLIGSFRSFLHEATGFYYSFIQRLAMHFQLEQLEPIIKRFGLITEALDDSGTLFSEDVKHKAVLSCHKSLIFLGDLARYREMQNERQRKNWNIASDYYYQALQLVPDNGNPHNQLAVIATYNSDDLSAIYRYYRSLVVRHPFLTAKDNLSFMFSKAKKASVESSESPSQNPQNDKAENFNRRRLSHQRPAPSSVQINYHRQKTFELMNVEFIRLHSILYLKSNVEVFSKLKTSFLDKLKENTLLVALESDQILKLLIINIAALFVLRHINNENGQSNGVAYSQSSKKALIEKFATLLILDTFNALLEVCNTEFAELIEDAKELKSAVQALPAAVKRLLAPLRIAIKWIKVSLEYLAFMSDIIAKDKNIMHEHAHFSRFWETLAQFLNSLERLFPHDQGIPIDVPLHEDFEMNGFMALKSANVLKAQELFYQDEPFEEYDMRIYDIVEDAKYIADSKESLLYFVDGLFTARKPVSPVIPPLNAQVEIEDETSNEDVMETQDSLTNNNSNDLFESQSFASSSPKALSGDANDDEDEEVILFIGRHKNGKEHHNPSVAREEKRSSPNLSASPSKSVATEILEDKKPSTTSPSNTITIEALFNGSQNLSTESRGQAAEQQSYWHYFNTPQLFANNLNELQNINNKMISPSNTLNKTNTHEIAAIPESPKNNTNGTYQFAPFPPNSPPIAGVPDASQDPLVLPTNRQKPNSAPTPPKRLSISSNSASLFAFPGLDNDVGRYNLFGIRSSIPDNNATLNNTESGMTTRTLLPPPGFSSPIGHGFPSNNITSSQASNAFGFSSFDVPSQLQRQPTEVVSNGFPGSSSRTDVNYTLSGTESNELRANSYSWFSNSAITASAQFPDVSFTEKRQSNPTSSSLPYLSNGWTPTSSIG